MGWVFSFEPRGKSQTPSNLSAKLSDSRGYCFESKPTTNRWVGHVVLGERSYEAVDGTTAFILKKLKTEYDPLPSKLTAILQAKVTCNKSGQSLQSGSIKNRLQWQLLMKEDMHLAAGEKI